MSLSDTFPMSVRTHSGEWVTITSAEPSAQMTTHDVATVPVDLGDAPDANSHMAVSNIIAARIGSRYRERLNLFNQRPLSPGIRAEAAETLLLSEVKDLSDMPSELRYAHLIPVACVNWAIRHPSKHTMTVLEQASAYISDITTISTEGVADEYAQWLAVEAQRCYNVFGYLSWDIKTGEKYHRPTYDFAMKRMRSHSRMIFDDSFTNATIKKYGDAADQQGNGPVLDAPINEVAGSNIAISITEQFPGLTVSVSTAKGATKLGIYVLENDMELFGILLRTKLVVNNDCQLELIEILNARNVEHQSINTLIQHGELVQHLITQYSIYTKTSRRILGYDDR